MDFMVWIVGRLNDTGDWFYQLYLSCYSAGWPLDSIASWFYGLSVFFYDLAWDFYEFSRWVNDVQSKVGNFLSWSTIWSYILSYVPNLTQIRDWFYSWVTYVTNTITSWWSAAQSDVKSWIAAAVQPFSTMLAQWSNFWNNLWFQWTQDFNRLKTDWNNFWKVTFPNLLSFDWLETWWQSRLLELQGLINTAVRDVAGMAEGWQDMRDNVVEFFNDPVEYIWDRFTDWFLGPEG